jgi:hypothetical protein
VKPDDLLKVSQTCLEEIILSEYCVSAQAGATDGSGSSTSRQTQELLTVYENMQARVQQQQNAYDQGDEDDDDDDEGDEDAFALHGENDDDDDESQSAASENDDDEVLIVVEGLNGADTTRTKHRHGMNSGSRSAKRRRAEAGVVHGTTTSVDASGSPEYAQMPLQTHIQTQPPSSPTNASAQAFRPYNADSQLEYMEECFALVALMIRGNAARMKVRGNLFMDDCQGYCESLNYYFFYRTICVKRAR